MLVSIFKNKGDVQSCSNYRGIKLISLAMKRKSGRSESMNSSTCGSTIQRNGECGREVRKRVDGMGGEG